MVKKLNGTERVKRLPEVVLTLTGGSENIDWQASNVG